MADEASDAALEEEEEEEEEVLLEEPQTGAGVRKMLILMLM